MMKKDKFIANVMGRTFQDWEIASHRIEHVSNDSLIIGHLRCEFLWLGQLDITINELCDFSMKGNASIDTFSKITMLSRLWILHAYEVVRLLDEFDEGRKEAAGGKLANFKSGKFKKIKRELAKIRVPMAKLLRQGHHESAFLSIIKPGTKEIEFVPEFFSVQEHAQGVVKLLKKGKPVKREDMAQRILKMMNSYTRPI